MRSQLNSLRATGIAQVLPARPSRQFQPASVLNAGPLRKRCMSRCSDQETFTITTPLYYANAEPHMGGAYSTIAADVTARFHRLQGKRVVFITGTDEHGEKIAESAARAGVSPQQHCDGIASRYKELWGMLSISYDRFVRTTDAHHEATVLSLLESVWQKGDIYKAAYSGRYCVACEEYKDDDGMDEDGNCLIHRSPCPSREEENYFFNLKAYAKELRALAADSAFIMPPGRRGEVAGWISEEVRDFSITRAAVDWGIRVPRDRKQTIYVWFDALIGYLSALLPEGVPPSAENLAAHGWPADVHVIGKDILRFHAVYWPGMLLSMGLPLPKAVFGHGFLTKDGLKMGKSLGNVLDPFALTAAYGADAVRFFFMKDIAFGADGNFAEQRFRDIVNASLANDIGNLLNRSLNLLHKNCGGKFPVSSTTMPADHPVAAVFADAVPKARDAYARMAFHDAIAAAQSISSRGNTLMEETAPWTALKRGSDTEKADAQATLMIVLEAVRVTAVLLSPIVPGMAATIYAQLGFAPEEFEALTWADATQWGRLKEGASFPKPNPVFARLEDVDLLVGTTAKAA